MTKKKSKKSLPEMVRASATLAEAKEAAKDPNLLLREETKLKAPILMNALGRGKSAILRKMAKKEGWDVETLELPTEELLDSTKRSALLLFLGVEHKRIVELQKKLKALEKRVKELETPTLEEAVRAHDLACGPSRPRDDW